MLGNNISRTIIEEINRINTWMSTLVKTKNCIMGLA